MESTQRPFFPDLYKKQRLEHIAAEEDRYLQLCLADPPVSAEEPLMSYGGHYQFQYPCETVPSYVPQHLQDAQEACDGTLMAMSGCFTARSADSVSYLRGAIQSERQVPRVSHDAYAQQPNFLLPESHTIPTILLPGCHQAFGIDSQPPAGYSDITKSPLEVSEQLIRTVLLKVRAGELREIVGHLTDNLQYLKTHNQGWGFTRDHGDWKELETRVWNNVNNAWLATLQHQRDLTREMMRTNQPIRDSDAIISPGALERLGDEVVKFCDDFEPHGLVDYQMGFWEEEIMDLMIRCLDNWKAKASTDGTY